MASRLGVLQYLDIIRCATVYSVNIELMCNQHRQVSLIHVVTNNVEVYLLCCDKLTHSLSFIHSFIHTNIHSFSPLTLQLTNTILFHCVNCFRYLAVTQPLNYSRRRRSKRLALVMILIVWTLALAITCPPILGW